jgi:DNA-binding MarR family transcriptional regulator
VSVDAGLDADTVGRLRAALGRIARRLRAVDAQAGLTPTEASVLASVTRRGRQRMSDLAAVEAINPTMLSRVVGRLEQLRLVERSPALGDRRSTEVIATSSGRRLHERLRAQRTAALLTRLERLPPGSSAALVAALPALEELADALSEKTGDR